MTWAMVDGGDDDACAVRTDGSLWCWGRFRPGGAAPLTHVADDFATIAVRGRHRCGIETDGSLWCFGSNYSGELGIGRLTIPQSSPQRVGSRSDWAVVTVGGPAGSDGFSCAVPTNGTLWCWGDNQYGQLGDGGRLDSSSPRQVGSDTDWARVHAGAQHVCAVKTGGSLWCWGNAADGRLGPGSGPPDEPRRVGTETGWTDVRAGSVSTCALRDATGGSIWCFGGNQSGEAGDDTPARTGVPAPSPACL
jgi:alpha-tubulin suppressor-like RCC1 family protein